ncbi:ORF6N domain-containing protein [Oceanivirga salmonicida]|uniref:ORF6N domain-containing protein n=1 Tax=Oceanivirga salmonicida TaxID=1769291 RepID=UPI000833D08A|nr:ORF6N domain-containing protein [Oceanivirga salmonicida]
MEHQNGFSTEEVIEKELKKLKIKVKYNEWIFTKKGEKMDNNLIEIKTDNIKNLIYTIRGKQVMLDSDLAMLYQVETRVLNQAVKRNIKRFPEKFMFRLTDEEYKVLISQIVISKNY